MLFRSLLFNTLLYPYLAISMVLLAPTIVLPRRHLTAIAKLWCRGAMMLHRVVIGAPHVWIGEERLPKGGLIVAVKHQSMWETLALFPHFDDPVFVLKKELMYIPVFGWWMKRFDMVPVDRSRGSSALAGMMEASRRALDEGRQILIFPEGTRRPPGAEPAYKFGIVRLYEQLGATVVPVALDAGLVWQRRRMVQRKGRITVEILPPIPPGLPPRAFFHTLQDAIEGRCDSLLLEAAEREGEEDMPESARARIAALRAAAATTAGA
jgi:1-acyl-sn-glycerol-3-phosphate acyltransferase